MASGGGLAGQLLGRQARQASLDRLFQSHFLGVADHDPPLRHLDLARDRRVDQAGFVFLERGDLLFLDGDGIPELLALPLNECDDRQ